MKVEHQVFVQSTVYLFLVKLIFSFTGQGNYPFLVFYQPRFHAALFKNMCIYICSFYNSFVLEKQTETKVMNRRSILTPKH